MKIYYQHVGERGGARDFPRSIGTQEAGLRLFFSDDVAEMLVELPSEERQRVLTALDRVHGFQIWGFPAGASKAVGKLRVGDWVLLLDTDRPGGRIVYGGEVIARPDRPLPSLSEKVWGEGKFSLIVFLKGVLAGFDWEIFRESLGYSPNLQLRGMTNSIAKKALTNSEYQTEEGLLKAVLGVGV